MKKLNPKIFEWKKKIGKNQIEFKSLELEEEEFKEFLKEQNEEIKKHINETVETVFKTLEEEQNEQIN